MNANDVVVGMGEVLWDMLPEGKKIGGAPANFAYHVSQFGLPSCVVSAVGEDALGKEILDNFTSKGLNCHIATVPYATGTVQVSIDQAGVPQYEIKENVAWDNIPYTPALEALARRTKAVCFGSLAQRSVVSRNTIGSFLDAMPENDETLVVFDVNLRQGFYNKEILCNSMKRCNILKINDEELIQVSRMFGYPGIDLQDKCWILLGKYNLKMLILTCGINAYVVIGDNVTIGNNVEIESFSTIGNAPYYTLWNQNNKSRIRSIYGCVNIKNNVRIGSYCSIDNGITGETVIGSGCKLGNFVEISHDVRVGNNCHICTQTAICGLVSIGNDCVFWGRSGVTNRIKIAPRTTLLASSVLTKSVLIEGQTFCGFPAMERIKYWKKIAQTRNQ